MIKITMKLHVKNDDGTTVLRSEDSKKFRIDGDPVPIIKRMMKASDEGKALAEFDLPHSSKWTRTADTYSTPWYLDNDVSKQFSIHWTQI